LLSSSAIYLEFRTAERCGCEKARQSPISSLSKSGTPERTKIYWSWQYSSSYWVATCGAIDPVGDDYAELSCWATCARKQQSAWSKLWQSLIFECFLYAFSHTTGAAGFRNVKQADCLPNNCVRSCQKFPRTQLFFARRVKNHSARHHPLT